MELIPIPVSNLRSDYEKRQIATESAYSALLEVARGQGIALKPCMGLMYLPSQEVTAQFIAASRAVLDCLALGREE